MRRYELTDDQWELIADLFPEQTMGRPRRSDRTVLNGILWILCSGAAWRDLPERYGPWKTVYHRFRQWEASGLFDRILERLHVELDEQGLIDCATWMIDSTSVRASRAAAGAPVKKGAWVLPIRPSDAPGAD
jgi:transposase